MRNEITFRKAERKKAKLRLALCGVSGSGKTYSSILMAKGLGGKIAMIDTENGSGELYAHIADYDVLTITAPYEPIKYVQAIKAAERAGYSVMIIDSLTHAWEGTGGVTEMADKAAKSSKSGNSFMAWRDVTPKHNELVEAILTSSMHIIGTMRSKTAYEVQDNGNGKKAPVKVGLAPIQRPGMEYEFTVVLDLSMDNHIATASKDRTEIFTGKHTVLNEETGETLLKWLNTGADAPPPEDVEGILDGYAEAISMGGTMDELATVFQIAQAYARQKATHRVAEMVTLKDGRKAALTPPPPKVEECEFTKGLDAGDAEADARDAKEAV